MKAKALSQICSVLAPDVRFNILAYSENGFAPDRIAAKYTSKVLAVDQQILELREKIMNEQLAIKESGGRYFWNENLFGLRNVRQTCAEPGAVELTLGPGDYYLHLALSAQKGEPSPRAGIQFSDRPSGEGEYKSASFGVVVCVISSDGYLVLTRRSRGLKVFPDFYNASVSEALSASLDLKGDGAPDVVGAAVRGVAEEIGLTITPDQLKFFSVGADPVYQQWGIDSMVKVAESAEEIETFIKKKSLDGKYENSEFIYMRHRPEHLLKFCAARKPWVAGGLVGIINSLIAEYGAERILAEAKKI